VSQFQSPEPPSKAQSSLFQEWTPYASRIILSSKAVVKQRILVSKEGFAGGAQLRTTSKTFF
jgi:hypothetical protein